MPTLYLVAPFLDRRCKHSAEEVQAAVDGAISREQAVKLRECLRHIDELDAHRLRIDTEIERLADPHSQVLDLIRTVPGFASNPLTAIALLAEIGAEMSVFPSAKHLCSWAGCCPRNDQSAGKVKSTRISRSGAYIKPLLVQVSNAVIRSKDHPEFAERYRRIKARRGHKKAIIAICRMLLTAIWNIIDKLVPYVADGFLVELNVEHSTVITVSQALQLLRVRGYIIKDDTPAHTSA